jgi:O-antigen/teichoic acid export membrane protein
MTTERLRYRDILVLWLPLALSGEMISIAGPVVQAGISRLPEPTVNLAAYGFLMSIAVLVEGPVIMLITSSVALVRNRESYLLLRRFLIHLSLLVTGVGFLLYFTPLYDLVFTRLMAIPPDIVQVARPALRILLFWPLAIAVRRFFQGILIWQGESLLITYGTVFRLVSLVATVVIGVSIGSIPGAVVGGLAMAVSVTVEMVVIAWWARPIIREKVMSVRADPDGEPTMSYSGLLRFYWPLAGTDIMRILARPVTTTGIARMPNPTLSLAAWPVANSLTQLLSSMVTSVQEVTLARIAAEDGRRRLSIFALVIGGLLSGMLVLVSFTGVSSLYFESLMGVPADVQALAIPATRILALIPLLYASRNFLRGVMIWQRRTGAVQLAMFMNLLTLVIFLALGITFGGLKGVILAAGATVGAQFMETVSLRWLSRRLAEG